MFHSLETVNTVGQFVSPSAAKAYLDQVNEEYTVFGGLVIQAAMGGTLTDSQWINHWGTAHTNWALFYNEKRNLLDTLFDSASVYNETEAYQNKLRAFMTEFEELTGQNLPGGISVDPPGESGGPDLKWYHWLGIAGGVGLLAYGIGKVT